MLKISIITAVFNREKTIKSALSSIKSQSFSNVESIVIDGASIDNTLKIVRSMGLKGKIISEPDRGIYDALNKGVLASTGNIIGILHSDDFYPNKNVLKKVSEAFKDPKILFVYGDLDYVSNKKSFKVLRRWKSSEFNVKKLFSGWAPPHPTIFVRRRIFSKIGMYSLNYKISSDYAWSIKLMKYCGNNSFYIPQVLVKMRVGGVSNKSFSCIILKMYEDLKIIMEENIGGLHTLIKKNVSKISQFL